MKSILFESALFGLGRCAQSLPRASLTSHDILDVHITGTELSSFCSMG